MSKAADFAWAFSRTKIKLSGYEINTIEIASHWQLAL